MSSLSSPIPVLMCGQSAVIGGPVAKALAPEIEVIHFMQGLDQVKADLATALRGEKPEPVNPNDVGTGNFTQLPRAVIFGRALPSEQIEELRKVTAGSNKEPVAWLVSSTPPPPPGSAPPGYAQEVAQKTKNRILQWINEGAQQDGIILY